MKIIDIINGPWAITPPMLNEVRSIYAKHLRGEKLNLKEIEAATGIELKNKPQGYEVINGSAIIQVEGVIAKKMNLFMNISGGASTQLIERDIRNALNDPAVNKIILLVDSPGGTVDGTFELAEFIYEQRGKKPIIAFTDGQIASAAYAIASAADQIYISGNTVAVGSIGVVAAHEDISKMEEKLGIKTTEIYSGKYKRIISQYAPLSDEGRKTIQDEVDYLYSVFIDAVAKFRGTTAEDVLERMSTDSKRIFIGHQAIEAGLVDGVYTLDGLINMPAGSAGKEGFRINRNDNLNAKEEEKIMALAELKEKYPDIYKAAFDEGRLAGIQETADTARKEGATAERTRMKSVREQIIPGHEALIDTLMFDGETTGEQAAVKVLAAEKGLRESKLDAFRKEGNDIKVPVDESGKPAAINQNLPVEERAKAEWDNNPGLRAEFGDFSTYLAFEKAHEEGKVKILKK